MVVLGIDPGLRLTGYGGLRISGRVTRIVEAGVIKSSPRGDLCSRLSEIAAGLDQVIESTQPSVVVVESLYSHYKHPRTAILMGHVRGVLIFTAAKKSIPVVDYPATRIKKSLTGNGRASKMQMQKTICAALELSSIPEPADVADALAVALCHANVMARTGALK